MSVDDRREFSRYVKDALSNLYDPIYLHTHPLIGMLMSHQAPGETSGESLRRFLRETIESLQPLASVPSNDPAWLCHRILSMRYLQSQGQAEICRRLGLSRASYYRRHRKALEAVAGVLWEKCPRPATAFAVTDNSAKAEPSPERWAEEEAVKLAHASRRQLTDLAILLEGVERTFQPLAGRMGITLTTDVPASLPMTFGDPAILRQIVLNVLLEGVNLAAASSLNLEVRVESEETIWRLAALEASKVEEKDLKEVKGFAISQALLEAYGGRLWVESEQHQTACICFTIPIVRPKTLLIIDDSRDAISLYQRYIQTERYVINTASTGNELWALLAGPKPDLILLDVLLPREDGWEILQRLKADPETKDISVVICSVLDQPELALALGAAAVLQKPIDRDTLLKTLQTLLHQQDSWGKGHQGEPEGTLPL